LAQVRQKKNIEWSEASINAITGCNGPGGVRCSFCYAQRIACRFKGGVHGYPQPDPFAPAFHPKRMDPVRTRKKPTLYFFGSMCDWLDDGVKPGWRFYCLSAMAENDRHIFITLTKQYKNLWKIAYDSPWKIAGSPSGMIPWNVWVGISICYRSQVWGLKELRKVDASVKFVSFEPLKEDVSNIIQLEDVDWIIIGAQSKQPKIDNLPAVPYFRPEKTWVQRLVEKAREAEIPVFLKPNLGDYVADGWFDKKIEERPDPYEHAPEVQK